MSLKAGIIFKTIIFMKQKYGLYSPTKILKNISMVILVAMLNYCSSSECWSNIPSLMQAWIRHPIPSLYACFAVIRHQWNFLMITAYG